MFSLAHSLPEAGSNQGDRYVSLELYVPVSTYHRDTALLAVNEIGRKSRYQPGWDGYGVWRLSAGLYLYLRPCKRVAYGSRAYTLKGRGSGQMCGRQKGADCHTPQSGI